MTVPGAPRRPVRDSPVQDLVRQQESATETVTPMLDQDKKWRVSGYFIK